MPINAGISFRYGSGIFNPKMQYKRKHFIPIMPIKKAIQQMNDFFENCFCKIIAA